MDYNMPTGTIILLQGFTMITSEELLKIVSAMNKTTCSSDPFVNVSFTDYYRYHYAYY